MKAKLRVCGHCAGAARTDDPARSHARCPTALGTGDDRWPCACGSADHRFDLRLAEHFARYTALPVEEVYERHGRKRRTYSDEERAAAGARLAAARARKGA